MNLDLLLTILGLIFIAFEAFSVPQWWVIKWGWLGVLLIGIVALF